MGQSDLLSFIKQRRELEKSKKEALKMFYIKFGLNVKRARTKAKITQDDLAKIVGLSRTSITNIEGGGQRVLLHDLIVFAGALGVKPEQLIQ